MSQSNLFLDHTGCRGFTGPVPPPLWIRVPSRGYAIVGRHNTITNDRCQRVDQPPSNSQYEHDNNSLVFKKWLLEAAFAHPPRLLLLSMPLGTVYVLENLAFTILDKLCRIHTENCCLIDSNSHYE